MNCLSLLFCSFGLVAASACSSTSDASHVASRPRDTIGEPIVANDSIALSQIGARAEVAQGQTVLVEATARDVCTRKGCWMRIEDGGQTALVRWKRGCGGEYAFPADVVGQRVLVQGTVDRAELSAEDVEHMLEEAQQGLDPRHSSLVIHASAVVVLRASD